jgi:16S rRNA processing protein RimM
VNARSPWVELGRIGAPFGLAGWVHVSSYTDPPEALLEYAEWQLRRGTGGRQPARLLEGRLHGERLVAHLQGIEDRDAAARLTGATIEVERSALPPAGARRYYCADLIGCAVENTEGRALGTVAYFVDAPAGAVMVVEDPGAPRAPGAPGTQREHWVLADPTHLLEVDLAARRVLVDWPAELD